jgi:LuxR family maltose regulon positive regulatory protein
MYVLARALFASSRITESQLLHQEIKELSEKLNIWPWYFIADGFIARESAYQRDMAGALSLIREERTLLSSFNFNHQLSFIPDVNELYVRFLISDWDRVEILISRVPNLLFVQQIATFLRELKGEDMLNYIESLPDSTPAQKVYKLMALADYFKDKESISVDYMYQTLQLVEKYGYVELVLRQHDLVNIVLKAIARKPTVFLENIATRLAERMKHRNSSNLDGMSTPLTTRELEVVKLLATGSTISAIGSDLHISMNTMKTHLRNIYRKLEVDGRDSAVEKAKELFLI